MASHHTPPTVPLEEQHNQGASLRDRAEEFVTFSTSNGCGEHTVRLRQPIVLYDETPHSPYRKARARAARNIKRQIGLHPCAVIKVEPHNWSDGVDALTAQVLA